MFEIAKRETYSLFLYAAAVSLLFVTSTLTTTSPALAVAQGKLGSFTWMSCSEEFSNKPKMAQAAKGYARLDCPSDPRSRQEAFNMCRDQYGAMTLVTTRTHTGWQCRYSSPTGKPRKK
jgi:hypothetical protein